tara:strand:+ start:79 stop:447 length:369 start_codon:yes stop_codon:yes gene_type:complete
MAVKSAKNGTVRFDGAAVAHATDISVEDSVDEDVYASSSTGGQKSRIRGHEDASGSFTVIQKPSFNVGSVGILLLKEDGSVTIFNGGAQINSIGTSVPVEGGTRIVYTVAWGQKLEGSSSFS